MIQMTMSPIPVRGAHLPSGVEGNSKQSVKMTSQQHIQTEAHSGRCATAQNLPTPQADVRASVNRYQCKGDNKIGKQPVPVLGSKAAHIEFIDKIDVNNIKTSPNDTGAGLHQHKSEYAPLQQSAMRTSAQMSAPHVETKD